MRAQASAERTRRFVVVRDFMCGVVESRSRPRTQILSLALGAAM
jgi:hypothetical protein